MNKTTQTKPHKDYKSINTAIDKFNKMYAKCRETNEINHAVAILNYGKNLLKMYPQVKFWHDSPNAARVVYNINSLTMYCKQNHIKIG